MQLLKSLSRALAAVGAVLALAVVPATAQASFQVPVGSQQFYGTLDLSRYQITSGPAAGLIKTYRNGTVADPYFSLTSLIIAGRYGMDTRAPAARFIDFGLRNQLPNGSFERWCMSTAPGSWGLWSACRIADADDSLAILWPLLLYREAPNGVMPAQWQESFARSEALLDRLKLANGIYRVFDSRAGYATYSLYMDNVEVLKSMQDIAALARQRGDQVMASRWQKKADELDAALRNVFNSALWMPKFAYPGDYKTEMFYPHAVGLPFMWMHGVQGAPSRAKWDRWLSTYGEFWDAFAVRDFPWGLVALAGMDAGDTDTARCWVAKYHQRANGIGGHWFLTEEMVLQTILTRVPGPYNCQPASSHWQ